MFLYIIHIDHIWSFICFFYVRVSSMNTQVKIELLGRTKSEQGKSKLIAFLHHKNAEVVKMAASYIGEIQDQRVIQPLWKRLKDITNAFLSQKVFGGPDTTGNILTDYIYALSYLDPKGTTHFLRDHFLPEQVESNTKVLHLFTEGAKVLIHLYGPSLIPELVGRLENSQIDSEKDNLLSLIHYFANQESVIETLSRCLQREDTARLRGR